MTRQRGVLAGLARLLGVLAVLTTVGAGVGAAVVQAQEEPSGSATEGEGGSEGPTPAPPPSHDLFAEPAGGFDYRNWVLQSGAGATYRVPGGWRVTGAQSYEAKDADGAVVARGTEVARYYGNNCSDSGRLVSAAWTALADPVPGTDAAAEAERAAVAWARSYAKNAAGTTAPISDPVTDPEVTLADGSTGARSVLSVDWTVFSGPCYPRVAEVAVTTVPRDGELVSLFQTRFVLDRGGVTDAEWSAIAASLSVG